MKETIKKECSAFCPKCSSDLYFLDGVCYCKNTDCDYTCDNCKKENDKLFFTDDK